VQRYGQIWSWFEQERPTGRGKKKKRRKRRNNPLVNILWKSLQREGRMQHTDTQKQAQMLLSHSFSAPALRTCTTLGCLYDGYLGFRV
jgi:hypothetical protein